MRRRTGGRIRPGDEPRGRTAECRAHRGRHPSRGPPEPLRIHATDLGRARCLPRRFDPLLPCLLDGPLDGSQYDLDPHGSLPAPPRRERPRPRKGRSASAGATCQFPRYRWCRKSSLNFLLPLDDRRRQAVPQLQQGRHESVVGRPRRVHRQGGRELAGPTVNVFKHDSVENPDRWLTRDSSVSRDPLITGPNIPGTINS